MDHPQVLPEQLKIPFLLLLGKHWTSVYDEDFPFKLAKHKNLQQDLPSTQILVSCLKSILFKAQYVHLFPIFTLFFTKQNLFQARKARQVVDIYCRASKSLS